jgi:hypothetical protein
MLVLRHPVEPGSLKNTTDSTLIYWAVSFVRTDGAEIHFGKYHLNIESQDSSVGITMGYGLENRVSISG